MSATVKTPMPDNLLPTQVEILSGRLRDMLLNGNGHAMVQMGEIESSLAELRRLSKNGVPKTRSNDSASANKAIGYQHLIDRIRDLVRFELMPGVTTLVVSKGDNELLKLDGRPTWHFPRNDDGVYAGYHPADSAAAIAHLEKWRGRGAGYLLFPKTGLWWLDFYGDFRRHLESHYRVVVDRRDVCVVFALKEQLYNGRANGKAEFASALKTEESPRTMVPCQPLANPSEPENLAKWTERCLEFAGLLVSFGNEQKAHEVLSESLRFNPAHTTLLLELAKLEMARGNDVLADEYANRALALAPEDYQANLEVAKMDRCMKRWNAAEHRLEMLLEAHPARAEPLEEWIRLSCQRLEEPQANSAILLRLLNRLEKANNTHRLSADANLLLAQTLSENQALEAALACLDSALRIVDFTCPALVDFVTRLCRPVLTNKASFPFGDRRALGDLLTHLGNGFQAVHQSFKARACYQLAAAANPSTFAASFNLAFLDLAQGDAVSALRRFSGASRLYKEESELVVWPGRDGHAWPHCPYPLREAFEKLRPPGKAWPKITVITPSFNQVHYIEETLLSVLNQDYPNLEYIVVDGDSTDGSIDVLLRYRHRLNLLIIEPDKGQTDALNKGLRQATGDILLWTNSDDMLAPGALFMMALAHLEGSADLFAGFCMEHNERRFGLINLPAATQATFNLECLGDIFNYWLKGHFFYQPEVAFTRCLFEKVGAHLDDSLYYTMDYEFWLRCAQAGARLTTLHWPIALFRKHEQQKTTSLSECVIEQARVRDRFTTPQPGFERKLEIRDRLAKALLKRDPQITVVSTRASKIFSPDTARELREVFAEEGMTVHFRPHLEDWQPARDELILLLVHLYKEHHWLRKLRERGHQGPIVGWFWDNHHNLFANRQIIPDLDVCIPGHAFAGSYLRSNACWMDRSEPLCVTQWTATEAGHFFAEHGLRQRRDALYGGFVRYAFAQRRNILVERLVSAGMDGVYFLEEHALGRYFDLSQEERFRQWCEHKVSLCLPLAADLSQRVFDALLTGQVPVVPRNIKDFDHVIPPDLQDTLPIVRFRDYTPEAVAEAHTQAIQLFDRDDEEGAQRRHAYAMKGHMLSSRVASILAQLGTATNA